MELIAKYTVVFLERLETYPALPMNHLLHLDALYRFSQITNSEIRMPFYLVVLKDPTSPAAKLFVQPVLDWVIGKESGVIQGRMKFCRPLFRAADKVDHAKTVAAYESAQTLFHPIARKLIEQVSPHYVLVLDAEDDCVGSGAEWLRSCSCCCNNSCTLMSMNFRLRFERDDLGPAHVDLRGPVRRFLDQKQSRQDWKRFVLFSPAFMTALLSLEAFGVSSPFDPTFHYVTSPVFPPVVLAVLRLVFAVYALVTITIILARYQDPGTSVLHLITWQPATHPFSSHRFFSYFTNLTYIGLVAYFWAAGVQSIAFVLRGRKSYPLQTWPRFLQLLHVLLYSTIIVLRAFSGCLTP